MYSLFVFYFLYSFSFSPRGRFVFQTEISGKYIVLVLISRLFYFLSSLRRGDQSTVFLYSMLVYIDPYLIISILKRTDTAKSTT